VRRDLGVDQLEEEEEGLDGAGGFPRRRVDDGVLRLVARLHGGGAGHREVALIGNRQRARGRRAAGFGGGGPNCPACLCLRQALESGGAAAAQPVPLRAVSSSATGACRRWSRDSSCELQHPVTGGGISENCVHVLVRIFLEMYFFTLYIRASH
jgi:hypothetical protein